MRIGCPTAMPWASCGVAQMIITFCFNPYSLPYSKHGVRLQARNAIRGRSTCEAVGDGCMSGVLAPHRLDSAATLRSKDLLQDFNSPRASCGPTRERGGGGAIEKRTANASAHTRAILESHRV